MWNVNSFTLEKDKEECLELVAATDHHGSRDTVWHALQTDPDRNDWTGWQPFGNPGGGAGGPAALQRYAEGSIEVVVAGRDESVWRRWQTKTGPNGWSDWSSLGAPGGDGLLGSPALRQNEDERLEVFVPRQDGSLWHCWQRTTDIEGAWSTWHPFGLPHNRVFVSPPAVTSDYHGRLEAFATVALETGTEPAMWHRWQTAPGHGWSDWSSLGTPSGGHAPYVPVLGQNVDGRLELFTVADDNAVWHRRQQHPGDPESWEGPWRSLGHQAGGCANIAVTLDARGRLTLVAISVNDRDLWLRAQATPDSPWGPWSPLGTVPTKADGSPSLHVNHDGGLEVFLRTPSTGGLYQFSQTQPDGNWTPGRRWPRP